MPSGVCQVRQSASAPFSSSVASLRQSARVFSGQSVIALPSSALFSSQVQYKRAEEGGKRQSSLIFRSEEHTSELQSLMRISYAVFCLKKKTKTTYEPQLHIKQ